MNLNAVFLLVFFFLVVECRACETEIATILNVDSTDEQIDLSVTSLRNQLPTSESCVISKIISSKNPTDRIKLLRTAMALDFCSKDFQRLLLNSLKSKSVDERNRTVEILVSAHCYDDAIFTRLLEMKDDRSDVSIWMSKKKALYHYYELYYKKRQENSDYSSRVMRKHLTQRFRKYDDSLGSMEFVEKWDIAMRMWKYGISHDEVANWLSDAHRLVDCQQDNSFLGIIVTVNESLKIREGTINKLTKNLENPDPRIRGYNLAILAKSTLPADSKSRCYILLKNEKDPGVLKILSLMQ